MNYKEHIEQEYEDSLFRMAIMYAAQDESREIVEQSSEDDRAVMPPVASKRMIEKKISRQTQKERFRKVRRISWKIGSRIAAVLLVVVLIGSALTLSVEAVGNQVAGFIMTFHHDHAEIELNNPQGSVPLPTNGDYLPRYIPEGFSLKSITLDASIINVYYENAEELAISISGYTSDMLNSIDMEDMDSIETVDVNGHPGLLTIKNELVTLTWELESYYFFLRTTLNKEEALKIADSIR